ncbi:MAG: NUMOD3 domain-containing DNA-binding protein [Candidatus Nanopelagicales bacterium]
MEYYTYAYLREDGTPYYIGKGKGKRIYEKRKGEVNLPKDKSKIIFLKQNLTEEEAFKHEIYMIDVFGRKDLGTGILHNRTNGGDGGSGIIFSEETKRKISERQSCEGNSFYGRTHSSETIERMRAIKTGKVQSQETRDKIAATKIGIPRSKETIEKMRNANLGKTISQEVRDKISNSLRGDKHYMFGKSLSQETRDKISIGISGENNPRSNWWKITFADGHVIEQCGLANWSKQNGYNVGCICGMSKGIRKRHKDIISVEKL